LRFYLSGRVFCNLAVEETLWVGNVENLVNLFANRDTTDYGN